MAKRIVLICQHCGKTFERQPSRKRLFCSRSCHMASIAARTETTCVQCGKMINLANNRVKPQNFCSKACSQTYRMHTFEDRFWPKVDKTPGLGPKGDCWEWTGLRHDYGYGVTSYYGRKMGTHQISYVMHKGEIPKGMHVCHECDNPPCVNPAHLWLGTQTENMKDMYSKGRGAKSEKRARPGTKNHAAKITESDVLAIRNDPRILAEIAKTYGISIATTHSIKSGKTWKHVKEENLHSCSTDTGKTAVGKWIEFSKP